MGRESFYIHKRSSFTTIIRDKMKCFMVWFKVKQGGVIYGKKEGLSVFTFYMVKKFEKILEWKSLSVKEGEGEEDILGDKFC